MPQPFGPTTAAMPLPGELHLGAFVERFEALDLNSLQFEQKTTSSGGLSRGAFIVPGQGTTVKLVQYWFLSSFFRKIQHVVSIVPGKPIQGPLGFNHVTMNVPSGDCMPFVESDGANIYWKAEGSGPPILLIMGLSFTHEMWFRTLPAVRGRYRTIVFDNRGMGKSSVPSGPYTMARLAEDAKRVLEAAGEDSAHVVGASMGGMVAQEFAVRFPGAVRSLILACTSSSGLRGKWPEFGSLRAKCFSPFVPRRERELALASMLYGAKTPAEKIDEDVHVRVGCGWNARGFFNQLAGVLMWDGGSRLPRIEAPTLVVHGEEDRLVPPENGRRLARSIPNARFRLVPDAGHILTTDRPEICNEILSDFLERQPERFADASTLSAYA